MPMRELKLPVDLKSLSNILIDTFQYPENPEWSVQSDEQEQLVETTKNLASIWPLIRIGQVISPPMRDLLRGCVWNEDGNIVGVTLVSRRGATSVWTISTVGVLPGYRRRGIARKLIEGGIDLIHQNGGNKVWLDVIDGNLPAYQLYERLGFESYMVQSILDCHPKVAPEIPDLPIGFTQSSLDRFDWKTRYAFEKRIAPSTLIKYEPVEESRFRQPAVMRLLAPIILAAQGIRDDSFVIRDSRGQVVARYMYSIPRRGKGYNQISIRLDPQHPGLAPYMMNFLINRVFTLSHGKRVALDVPLWMKGLLPVAQKSGFKQRFIVHRMGLLL